MSRRVPEKCKLLFGPYEPPPLRKGDRVTCLYRDALAVVTSWSDGRISWPRCRALGHRGGSGLLIEKELARAILHESAAALLYWFGVTCSTVALWRKALGVKGRTGTEGSRRLVQAAQERAVAQLRGKRLPPEQVEQHRQSASALNLIQYAIAGRTDVWTKAELRLLGKVSDTEVAERTGRGVNAVRVKRCKLGIPTARDRAAHCEPLRQ